MKKMAFSAAAAALMVVAGAASAQGFDGASIRYQFLYPNTSTPNKTLNAVVGSGVEFVDTDDFYTVDLSGSTFTVVDTFGGSNDNTAFNGISLSDTTNNLATITGVTFTSGGFAGERPVVTFDANNIYLNFAGITQRTAANTSYRYAVTFANGAVPEPATWAMMLVGFGMVGGAVRYSRRKATVAFG